MRFVSSLLYVRLSSLTSGQVRLESLTYVSSSGLQPPLPPAVASSWS